MTFPTLTELSDREKAVKNWVETKEPTPLTRWIKVSLMRGKPMIDVIQPKYTLEELGDLTRKAQQELAPDLFDVYEHFVSSLG